MPDNQSCVSVASALVIWLAVRLIPSHGESEPSSPLCNLKVKESDSYWFCAWNGIRVGNPRQLVRKLSRFQYQSRFSFQKHVCHFIFSFLIWQELFIQDLAQRTLYEAANKHHMKYSDLAEIVNENESLQFLQGVQNIQPSSRSWESHNMGRPTSLSCKELDRHPSKWSPQNTIFWRFRACANVNFTSCISTNK